MGLEANCKAAQGKGKFVDVKAMLEGDHILVRSPSLRVRLMVADLDSVIASEKGILQLTLKAGMGEAVRIDLGSKAAAEKWVQKILHPPTRLDKLGVKAGVTVLADGRHERDFLREIEGFAAAAGPAEADIVFSLADSAPDLARSVELARGMRRARAALWVVYPKGVERIRQEDVFAALRGAGFVDTKVCGFSSTHTALRFTRPKADGGKPVK
jgi:hypothetical protein